MDIIFRKKEGIPGFFQETAKMKKSTVSNDSIDIFINADEVIFYPKSGKVAAFKISQEEMIIIFDEIGEVRAQ